MLHLVIGGIGSFAQTTALASCRQGVNHIFWNYGLTGDPENHVAIYAGKGRELPAFVAWCAKYGVPLIQASTDHDMVLADNMGFPLVHAPNLSVKVVTFLEETLPAWVASLGTHPHLFLVVESHQEQKGPDPSGTAREIEKRLAPNLVVIETIRKPEIQRRIGIPERFLGGHALHMVTCRYEGKPVKPISILVLGRDEYGEGAVKVAQLLHRNRKRLRNRTYSVFEVLSFPE